MKTTNKIIIVMGIASLVALQSRAGVGVRINIGVPAPPAVVVQAPPPAVTVEVGVPDYYVWDGYEYVGLVGDQYFYLGPGNVWLALDASRQARWHDWSRAHADWHVHATANVRYRTDAHGHDHPWQKGHGH